MPSEAGTWGPSQDVMLKGHEAEVAHVFHWIDNGAVHWWSPSVLWNVESWILEYRGAVAE
jgi:hypothetical protein